MVRFIDADALIESLTINPTECMGCPEPEWIDELIQILNTAPSVLINTEEDDGVVGHCKINTTHIKNNHNKLGGKEMYRSYPLNKIIEILRQNRNGDIK